YPKVAGEVACVAADGAGGWYIGGSFGAVGGVSHRNLAHILPGGTVDAREPDVDGQVNALCLSDGQLYVGGNFDHAGGMLRHYLAAFTTATGRCSRWNPVSAGEYVLVWALVASGGNVYIGGDFQTIGGEARSYLAIVDGETGAVTAWDPSPNFV